MKKLIAAALVAASLSLGACGTTGGLTAAQIQTLEQNVIDTTVAICKFEPTVATVAALVVGAVVPGAGAITDVATGIANSICAKVTASAGQKSLKRGAAPEIYLGNVKIEGHFVN